MRTIFTFCDGSCIPNPGNSTIGIHIVENNKTLKQLSLSLGPGTNNIAELNAVKFSLMILLELNLGDEINKIFTDSLYSIKILTDNKWKPKKNIELINEIKGLIKKFKDLNIDYVPGHKGEVFNEIVHSLAMEQQIKK